MKVLIKSFDVGMEVKTKGIEFEVRNPDGANHLGDCYLTMTGLIWCTGRTGKNNGIKISWSEFMAICQSKETLKAAIRAAKDASV